jgi:adenine-specific DNA-methyltransferase
MSGTDLLGQLAGLDEQQLRRLLVEHLTRQKLGLYWEASAIERDRALNADVVLPRLVEAWSHRPAADAPSRNLIVEGDNYDALRLLRATHRGKIRAIYIDPPYNTGNKDWVYNDRYVGANDRWRHSQWLEFLYRRLSLARDLLTPDGVILVSINDENRARLELLMDEVFPGMRVGSLVWRKRRPVNASEIENFFSTDHEHVLIYANCGFRFNGSEKNWSGYDNWDEKRQDYWTSGPMTLGFNREQRKNLYYPIYNPDTGIWYACNPATVWRFASKSRLAGRQVRTKTIEDMVADGDVSFPPEPNPVVFSNLEALNTAIRERNAPPFVEHDPDRGSWVGRKIGFGRPRIKRFKKDLKRDNQPLSSWVAELGKAVDDSSETFVVESGMTKEGTSELRDLGMQGVFQYSKPLSLIKNLLAQATSPNDTVLDFFAGSGTTGQAVLELNAEDGGQRRFILCSSSEAARKEPDKNLCRDVCAERMRRVIAGYGGKPGYTVEQGGEFAYLQLDKVEAADAHVEINLDHAFQLLALQRLGAALPIPEGAVKRLGRVGDCELLLCGEVNAATLETLAAWPEHAGAARLAVYAPRPKTLSEKLAARGVEANCYGLMDALLAGQGGRYEPA